MRFGRGLLLIVFLSGVARAQVGDTVARQAARDHYQKGSVAYELGHYDLAIAEYEAAYQAFNEPTLLYDLGQAHRLAGHTSQALHFYRMYLVKVPDAPNRADVDARIAALQTAASHASDSKAASLASTTPSAPSPPIPPLASARTAPAMTAAPIATASFDRGRARRLKITGFTLGALGLGLVGGGIGVGVLAKEAGDEISRANADHQPFDSGRYSTYQTDQIVAGVLIGVGAAALITGTTLAIIGVRRGRGVMAAQVVPQLSPGHAGLSARIRF